MRIIESIKVRDGRFVLVVDGVEHKEIFQEAVVQFQIKKGPVDDEKYERFMKYNDYLTCKEYTMKMLSYRMRTEKEIRKRLAERKFMQESIDKTIKFCEEYNYLSDQSYAAAFAELRAARYGRRRIKQELKAKGVEEEYIDMAFEALPEDFEEDTALGLARKRLHKDASIEEQNRVYRYLISHGISYDLAKHALFTALAEIEGNEEEDDEY